MKSKVFKYIVIFTWVFLIFCWAIYTNIPKGNIEYLVKTLPLILLGTWVIGQFFENYKQNN